MQAKVIAIIIIVIILIVGIFMFILLMKPAAPANKTPPPPPPPVYNAPLKPASTSSAVKTPDVPPPPPPRPEAYWSGNWWGTHNPGDLFTIVADAGSSVKITNYKGHPASIASVTGNIIRAYGTVGTYENGTIRWENGNVWTKTNSTKPLPQPPTNIDGWAGTWTNPADRANLVIITKLNSTQLSVSGSTVTVDGDNFELWGLTATLSGGRINWSNGIVWVPFVPIDFSKWVGTWLSRVNNDVLNITKANETQIKINNTPYFVVNDTVDTGGVTGTAINGEIRWSNGNVWTPYTGVSAVASAGGVATAMVTNVVINPASADSWVGNWRSKNSGGIITITKVNDFGIRFNGGDHKVITNGSTYSPGGTLGRMDDDGLIRWENGDVWTKV